ncbi:hypothetical protein Dimus_012092 [Dionaea muscipula]
MSEWIYDLGIAIYAEKIISLLPCDSIIVEHYLCLSIRVSCYSDIFVKNFELMQLSDLVYLKDLVSALWLGEMWIHLIHIGISFCLFWPHLVASALFAYSLLWGWGFGG